MPNSIPELFWQILILILGLLIELGVDYFFKERGRKIAVRILGGLFIAIALIWIGYGLGIREETQSETEPETALEASTFIEREGMVIIEAEHYTGTIPGVHKAAGLMWSIISDDSTSLGDGLLKAQTIDQLVPKLNTNDALYGPALFYEINFTETGNYHVYVRGAFPNLDTTGDHDSIHIGLNGLPVTLGDSAFDFNNDQLVWEHVHDTEQETNVDTVVNIPGTGPQLLYIWMRESGVRIDRIVLTRDKVDNPEIFNSLSESLVNSGN